MSDVYLHENQDVSFNFCKTANRQEDDPVSIEEMEEIVKSLDCAARNIGLFGKSILGLSGKLDCEKDRRAIEGMRRKYMMHIHCANAELSWQ